VKFPCKRFSLSTIAI